MENKEEQKEGISRRQAFFSLSGMLLSFLAWFGIKPASTNETGGEEKPISDKVKIHPNAVSREKGDRYDKQ